MPWIKFFISPTLIATFTCSLLASFTLTVNARPRDTIQKIQIPNTEISGNIVKGITTSNDISCSQITVIMKEYIPTKPSQNGFNFPKENILGQRVSATGNNLSQGCKYSLPFRYLPKIRTYGASTFQIQAEAGEMSGNQSVSYPFPNNIDIQIFPPPVIR
jgi:hypothetical protein